MTNVPTNPDLSSNDPYRFDIPNSACTQSSANSPRSSSSPRPSNSVSPHPAPFCVYMMCGIAGSGKSSFVKAHYADLPCVSRDRIKIRLGLCKPGEKMKGNPEQEAQVSEIQLKELTALLERHQSFVIDETCLKLERRNELRAILAPYHPTLVIVFIDTPLDQCLSRRATQIPISILEQMHKDLCPPTASECDHLIVISPD